MARIETGTVAGVEQVEPALFLVHLELPQLAPACAAGQFVLVRCTDPAWPSFDPYLPRSYFVLDLDPQAGRLSLLVRRQGRGSDWLCTRRAGDQLTVFGPAGRPLRPERLTRHLLLLVEGFAGSVVAASVASAAARQGVAVTLVENVLAPGAGLPASLLHADVEYQAAASETGGLLGALPPLLRWADEALIAAPPSLLETVAALRRSRLAPFTLHARLPVRAIVIPTGDTGGGVLPCGTGVCGACDVALRHRRATYCLDGPAFNLGDLRFEEQPDPAEEDDADDVQE